MPVIRTNERLRELEEQRDVILEVLKSIQASAATVLRQLRTPDDERDRPDPKALADARFWLKTARELELEIEKLKSHDAGISDGYGIDLARAKREVESRLARLAPEGDPD